MQINKYIGAIVLFLGLGLSAPAMAADCPEGKSWAENTALAAANNAAIVSVPKEQFQKFSDVKGPPPNTDLTKPFEVYLMKRELLGMLFIVQDGCVTVTAGPTLLENWLRMLGLSDA